MRAMAHKRVAAIQAKAAAPRDYIVAYPAALGVLTDWHGAPVGTWVATATWKVRGTRVYQIRATLQDGRIYTGRGLGVGMVFVGKRIASQRNGKGGR